MYKAYILFTTVHSSVKKMQGGALPLFFYHPSLFAYPHDAIVYPNSIICMTPLVLGLATQDQLVAHSM